MRAAGGSTRHSAERVLQRRGGGVGDLRPARGSASIGTAHVDHRARQRARRAPPGREARRRRSPLRTPRTNRVSHDSARSTAPLIRGCQRRALGSHHVEQRRARPLELASILPCARGRRTRSTPATATTSARRATRHEPWRPPRLAPRVTLGPRSPRDARFDPRRERRRHLARREERRHRRLARRAPRASPASARCSAR